MNHVSFYIIWKAGSGCVTHLVKRWANWATFCWETLGPAIHVDVALMCTTYLSIVEDKVQPFMEMVFLDGCGLFQQVHAPYHTAKMV